MDEGEGRGRGRTLVFGRRRGRVQHTCTVSGLSLTFIGGEGSSYPLVPLGVKSCVYILGVVHGLRDG